MKYVFKQAASFGFEEGGKIEIHQLGLSEVSDRVASHPYFLKLLGLGLIVDAAETNVVEPESLEERNARLAESLKAPKAKPKAKAEAEVDEDAEVSDKPVEADKKKKSRH